MVCYGWNSRSAWIAACLILQAATTLRADEFSDILNESDQDAHPLQATIQYASLRAEYIRDHVHDYSCRLIKRERIDGELQSLQFAKVKVRCQRMIDGEVQKPLAVFMQYLAPAHLEDRRVLYVEGENGGRMLVRKGGRAFSYIQISVEPDSRAARRESNYPITEIGFDRIIGRLIQFAEEDIRHDPDGENTNVSFYRNAKIGDRVCTRIQVIHPVPHEGLRFYRADIFVDDDLQVPVRFALHGWPSQDGDEPPLLEEYTYVDLRMNVGLTDEDFSRSQLGTSR